MEGDSQRAEHLFWLLQPAKRRWRRFTRKPVRRVRRGILRSFNGKSKGKRGRRRLNGRGVSDFLQRLSDDQYDEIFFGGKGRGKGRRDTPDKGNGRRGNPRGRDGQILKCHE
eukprot:3267086-Pyramimonas_sp.AAC.1